ncbi:hypothetical protein F2P79_002523 [Pimephales promelas]|nr:hypothetical protein F2P79_002523 [Pimephales promelas]
MGHTTNLQFLLILSHGSHLDYFNDVFNKEQHEAGFQSRDYDDARNSDGGQGVKKSSMDEMEENLTSSPFFFCIGEVWWLEWTPNHVLSLGCVDD